MAERPQTSPGERRDFFTRDGHKLVVTMGPDYTFQPDITCPGDCHLWGPNVVEARRREPCWLRYFVRDAGSEFFEWWSTWGYSIELGSPVALTAPIEIEWRYEGNEDEAYIIWRPVMPGQQREGSRG